LFKNDDSDISDKERFGRPATVKENELRKDGKKWKTMENISINLFFLIVIKKLQKINENFCADLINKISNVKYQYVLKTHTHTHKERIFYLIAV